MPRAAGITSKAFWLYQCTFQPYVLRVAATLMALLSALIVWSEGTLRFHWNNVSPFAAVRESLRCRVAAGRLGVVGSMA